MSIYGSGILNSLRIALRNMRRPVITLQYPHEKLVLPERARWAVTMTPDDEGNHKCTACMACEKACPDYVIEILSTTGEDRTKHIDHWRYEIGACMMCGLCVEACPFDAIHMGHDYELARTDPATLRIDLLTDTPAAKPKRAERPAPAEKPAPAAVETAEQPEPPASSEPSAADEGGDADA